tara:strand:- start:120 stop:539 length:420 start_codon:yes stop_codon:yes gene_type:complete
MPNFKKSRGFKMKGFAYPGISPLRNEKTAEEMKAYKEKYQTDLPEGEIQEETLTSTVDVIEKKDKKKEKGKIDWSKIATDAISSIVETGAQAGIQALTNPRKRTPKQTPPATMGNIKYGAEGIAGGGTRKSLLNNKKEE